MEQEDIKHWHLDKRVNLSHLFTTVLILIGLFQWGGKVETRIAILENDRAHQAQIMGEVKQELKEMNKKFDKLLEYSLKNGTK